MFRWLSWKQWRTPLWSPWNKPWSPIDDQCFSYRISEMTGNNKNSLRRNRWCRGLFFCMIIHCSTWKICTLMNILLYFFCSRSKIIKVYGKIWGSRITGNQLPCSASVPLHTGQREEAPWPLPRCSCAVPREAAVWRLPTPQRPDKIFCPPGSSKW